MASGQVGGAGVAGFSNEGAQSGPTAHHVGFAHRRGDGRVERPQQIGHILGRTLRRLQRAVVVGVGRAHVGEVAPWHDKDGAPVARYGKDRGGHGGQPVGPKGEVDPFGRPETGATGLVGVEGTEPIGPHTARVDHGRGLDLGSIVESGAAHPLAPVGAEGDGGGIVGGDGAVTGYRRAGDGQRQSGIVRPRIPVAEPGDQPPGVEGREVGQGLRAAQALMALTDAEAAGQVVKPEGGGVGAGDALMDHAVVAEKRNQKGQAGDQVRGIAQQPLAFGEGFVDQGEVFLLEIAKTTVDQLR